MAKYELNLPATMAVERGKDETFATVTVNIENLTDDIIGKLVLHGLKQKVADAAAGAKKLSEADDETRDIATIAGDLMQKVVTNLERGDWGAERDGGGTALGYGSAVDAAIISIMRGHVKQGAEAEYKAMKESERKTKCVEAFQSQTPETQAKIAAMAEKRVEDEKRAAEKVAELEIKINL